MFSVGRYDPNAECQSIKERSDDVANSVEVPSKKRKSVEIETLGSAEEAKEEVDTNNNNGNNDVESSSCPSSEDDSSSSAPSSEESDAGSDGEGDDDDDESAAFEVIAPEQKEHSLDKMRKRIKSTNEGIDDFDHDENKNQEDLEQSDEVKRAMRISKIPIKDAAKIWKLAPFLVENLEKDDYESFFPIQALVIPDVISSERHAHIRNRDICVASPTGSGKTLAFVIPVLNSLSGRQIRRLRALVVLPSRDLATQVFNVFETYAKGSDLKVGLAIGQNDFKEEQRNLLYGKDNTNTKQFLKFQHALDPFNPEYAMQAFDGDSSAWTKNNLKRLSSLDMPHDGISAIDILVCTPGRLMDHLDRTPGFTLQHLRFLVIDEADRLVNQSYQNWIQRVVDATHVGPDLLCRSFNTKSERCSSIKDILEPVTWRRSINDSTSNSLKKIMDISVCRPVQLRKLLFSATLTKDPKKLSSLGLINPKHYDAHQLNKKKMRNNEYSTGSHTPSSYSLPDSLSEFMVQCTAEQKPLVLLAVILEQSLLDKSSDIANGIVVVFTSSKDSTHRLARLLQLLWVAAGYGQSENIAEFSSSMNQKQRAELVRRCNEKNGDGPKIQIIVCSDGMSRGMDINSVSAVVNYDVPAYAKTYVHRCGRTARAGRKGRATTIMKGGQVSKFLKMRQLIGNPGRVSKVGIKKDLAKPAIPVYQKCIKALGKVMSAEANGTLSPVESLESE